MRIKTYLATYLLFLLVLFSCFGIVSAYMTRTQINMYIEKCAREFDTIAHTLFRDFFVLSVRDRLYASEIEMLLDGYATYYRQHNITFEVTDLSLKEHEHDIGIGTDMVISFIQRGDEHYIHIAGVLHEPFSFLRLDYYYSMTGHLADMRNIQNTLLFICIAFCIITAFILYFVLSGIFRPLSIVSKASEKIADGHYGERIYIEGTNELSAMARNFNRMAEEIESQIQLLEEEAAAKQQFIDNFAHEIRTPLTSIYGNAEYMQKALLEEGEVIEYTQFIMDKTNHMKQLSNSLLQLATLRNYMPVKSKIHLQQLFEDINKTLEKVMSDQKVKFVCKSDADTLDAQEDLIKSLILNLCFNSLKACSPGDGAINLEARDRNGCVEISVTDNGCGIPQDSLLKVMEPFYRVDKARSRNKGGTGLGLSICRQIAKVHGAKMVIESSQGTGTTVKVTFTTS